MFFFKKPIHQAEKISPDFEQDNLLFAINQSNLTASVLLCKQGIIIDRLLIPRSIKQGSQEYIIKSIGNKSFKNNENIKSIIFPEDSEIESLGDKAFKGSSLESIVIPSKVKQIGKYCFSHCHHLQNVKFSENSELEILDEGTFSESDINSIIIPAKVKQIGMYCFSKCFKFEKIEFSENSELNSIFENAFDRASFKSIKIPPKVTKIDYKCFGLNSVVERIEFDENSELKIFPKIINYNLISITIPSNVETFSDRWIDNSKNIISIDLSPRNKFLRYLDESRKVIVYKDEMLIFACRDVQEVSVPSYIKRIGPSCFSDCQQLRSIEIPEDSQLEFIDFFAFNEACLLERIFIPKNIKVIQKNVFNCCKNLKNVEYHKDSKLLMVKENAFKSTSIENISFPLSLQVLCDGWCIESLNMKSVTIPDENTFFICSKDKQKMVFGKSLQKNFDVLVFISKDIKNPVIPPFVTKINSDCFCGSKRIETIEFDENSCVDSFGNDVFNNSSIRYLSIPSKISTFPQLFCQNCQLLKSVELLTDDICELYMMSFLDCPNLFILSFPNAEGIKIRKNSSIFRLENLTIFLKCNSKVVHPKSFIL